MAQVHNTRALEVAGDKMRSGLVDIAADAGVPAQVTGVASMFQIFFNDNPVVDYRTAKMSDTEGFMKYQKGLLRRGVFIAPSQYETCFISAAHTDEDLDHTLEAMDESVKESQK